ncbi:hypothetical protein J7E50_06705 [Pedobacter sp. ISL-68]|uniref:hypothetical protein n=1 Tax=unclassified Pedobacter TaxID=2628915 RepID=UPI001BE89F17|nr:MULTISPECIES: hypothetical protein [unclassified Pedobacter]MBT2564449.1 hypothetical protein [Pedobacter sp. ISL-64]MBT2589901.1 hypothetical protein [Pedobacter sp. ISL-68]
MLAKGILMILCCGFLKIPLVEIKNQDNPQKPVKVTAAQDAKSFKQASNDMLNHIKIVYVKDKHDSNLTTFAKITIKNTMKTEITIISFRLDGDVTQGCKKAYEIAQKAVLKPNQSITIPQRLIKGDCEKHVIKDLRIKYTINVNFTLD